MTKTIVRMHFTLWRRAFSLGMVVQMIAFGLYGLGGALGLAIYLALGAPASLYAGIPALGVVMFWLFAGLIPSTEFQLQPEKFAALPIRPEQLRTGMLVATFLQIRSLIALVATLITTTGGLVALWGHPLACALWIVGNLLSFCLAVFGAESLAQSASLAKNRKAKERRGIITSVVVFGVWMAFSVLLNGQLGFDLIEQVARVSAYTPLGGFAFMGPAVAVGNYVGAFIGAAMGTAALWFFWRIWGRSFLKALSEPTAADVSDDAVHTSGSVVIFGQTPTTASALRSRVWRYTRRDTRLTQQAVIMPIVALGFWAIGWVVPDSPMPYFGGVMLAMSAGNLLMNCLGLDGPSNWVNMVTGVNPRSVLRNYAIAYGALAIPLLLPYLVLLWFSNGEDSYFPLVAMALPAAALSNIAAAFVLCVLNPFPTARPGTPAMKDRSQQSGHAFITVFVALGGSALPLVPGIALAYWFFVPGVLVTYATAFGLVFAGYRFASAKLDNRWPEIFTKVKNYV